MVKQHCKIEKQSANHHNTSDLAPEKGNNAKKQASNKPTQ
jgi:hypothetical protein